MLIQSPKTLPPPGFARPQWAELARKWDERKDRSVILDIEAGQIALGHDDKESEDKLHLEPSSWSGHEFGWDNENPQTAVDVKAFKVDSLPVTNGEYWKYMQQNDIKKIPGSWYTTDGVPDVKTLYGPVPMAIAQHWPLMASGKELASFAKWKGGRLPTESELRMLWKSDVGPRPAGLSSNVGVKRWHPVPSVMACEGANCILINRECCYSPTNTRIDSCGRILHGHNGGVWEWTSTKFASYPDFETSEVYPGYSTDFYDDIHLVVVSRSS
jgi:formylglycine-generating enzyme required for sulfatase activity